MAFGSQFEGLVHRHEGGMVTEAERDELTFHVLFSPGPQPREWRRLLLEFILASMNLI